MATMTPPEVDRRAPPAASPLPANAALDSAQIAILNKVRRRLLPVLMLCYVAAFLDRVNVGFAALQMNGDLGLSSTVFGIAAGLFFLGYVVFEIPSNLILARVGARRWIPRILISWGIVSACTAFVWDRHSFYVVRIILGAAEAGFYPGLLFYMTLWFPRAYRARVFSLTAVAVPISSVIGSPLSSFILTRMSGLADLRGWQWMFLIEGAPAVVMGIVAYFMLPDGPQHAKFLEPHERTALVSMMAREQASRENVEKFTVRQALTDGRVLAMCLISFGLVVGVTDAAIWMPQLVKGFGLSTMQTGFLAALPAFVALAVVPLCGWNADRTGARVAHVAVPLLCAAGGFVLTALTDSPPLGMLGLVIGAASLSAAVPSAWFFPPALLTGTASAAGLALINSVGSTGGFIGPYMIGWIRDATGSFRYSLLFLAAVIAGSALVSLVLGMRMRDVLRAAHLRSRTTQD